MNGTIFIIRVMQGDFIYTLAGMVWALPAAILASQARWPTWAKWLFGIALTIGMAIISHLAVEAVKVWWTTPLGEPMHIITH